ncbi:HDIG domain-containing metalloprotein [Solibacillus sp. CAU 1738]|uniref:HD family phosphohydrolase n=1 Tax=Solibacillus sp. CAU 1738 TaxID=3140363 RepID=UPI00325FFC07
MNNQLKKLIELINFRYFLIIVLLLTAIVQFLFMVGNVRGITYDIQLLQLAPETIRSVKTIEDTEKTEQERDNAEKAVDEIYVFNSEVANHRSALVTSIFDIALDVRNDIAEKKEKEKEKENDERDVLPLKVLPSKEKQIELLRTKLKDILKTQSGLVLTDVQLDALLTADETSLLNTRDSLANLVKVNLEKPIRKEQVPTLRNEFESKIRQHPAIAESLLNTSIAIGRAAIVETEVLNEEKTELRKQQAREAVEPTRILQGQIIVQEGELISREVYRQLELLGLLNTKSSIKPIIGLAILILLQMSFMYILFDRSKMELSKRRSALLVTTIVYTISITIMKLMSLVADNFDVMIAYLFPSALATMLVRLLANDKAASVVTIMTAASAGVIFHSGYAAVLQMDIALYIIFGGFATLFFMRSIEKRAYLLHACGILTIINILFITFYLLMSQSGYGIAEIGFYITAGIVSALLSGALTMGLLPFFESAFGLLSTMRLIELSNPNHPLLKKILTETPGTYHHSIMVANLAEAACEAIGADGLLARVGCYYHDVGKTRRPAFFIENQMSGINPHDSLPPKSSADIIIAHTTDGAELLRKHKMPQEIIDIALQHHGTSLLKFFLYKAKEEGNNIDESAFRYPGPKPQSKVAAVISIADSVEAATRSMKEPTAEKIQKLVQAIIQDRVQDDQFDECDISLKELKVIENVLCETLNGTFHSRIEYPK